MTSKHLEVAVSVEKGRACLNSDAGDQFAIGFTATTAGPAERGRFLVIDRFGRYLVTLAPVALSGR